MTIDEHVKAMFGDMTLKIAAQAAEIDALRAQLAAPVVPIERPEFPPNREIREGSEQ